MSKIVVTFFSFIIYARAFFVTDPDISLLMPGETRFYRIHYTRGFPASTAFEMAWYANRLDADADVDRLTDMDRLPSVEFSPLAPNQDVSDPEMLQDGDVRLTAPDTNGYENPVGVLLLTQDTDTIKPRIYLLSGALEIPTATTYLTYDFRYILGEPPINSFHVEWYASQLDAKRQINRLTDADRLPRAEFFPFTPNREDVEPEDLQDGSLRLYRPVSSMPYTSVYGLLCVEQDSLQGKSLEEPVDPPGSQRRERIQPQWER